MVFGPVARATIFASSSVSCRGKAKKQSYWRRSGRTKKSIDIGENQCPPTVAREGDRTMQP